jgi:hypothetical protein
MLEFSKFISDIVPELVPDRANFPFDVMSIAVIIESSESPVGDKIFAVICGIQAWSSLVLAEETN